MRHLKLVAKALVCLFATYALVELAPSTITCTMWRMLGFQAPVVSAFYRMTIRNECCIPVIITAYVLNDFPFRLDSEWRKRQDRRTGHVREVESLVRPGQDLDVILPSEVDRRIGFLMIAVRTEISLPGTKDVQQSVAFYSVKLDDARMADGAVCPIPHLTITDDQLKKIDLISIGVADSDKHGHSIEVPFQFFQERCGVLWKIGVS